jgi:hypothetical protein
MMRSSGYTLLAGFLLMVVAVIGLVVVPANTVAGNRVQGLANPAAPGLTTGTYEALMVLSWAVLIGGAIVVLSGIVQLRNDDRPSRSR